MSLNSNCFIFSIAIMLVFITTEIYIRSRNPWSIPKLKRKSSIVEMHTSSSIRFPEPISVLCERHRVDVPLLITKLIEEVENRGLTEEGIYRQSGSSSQVRFLIFLNTLFTSMHTDETSTKICLAIGVFNSALKNSLVTLDL